MDASVQHVLPPLSLPVMTPAPALTLNCTTLYNPYNGQAIVSLRWQVQGNENQLAAITGYEVVTTVISMAASEGIFFIVQPIALDTLSSNVSNLQVPLYNGHKNCIHVLPSLSSSQSYLHPHLHNHTFTLIFTILPPPTSSQSYLHPHLHYLPHGCPIYPSAPPSSASITFTNYTLENDNLHVEIAWAPPNTNLWSHYNVPGPGRDKTGAKYTGNVRAKLCL